MRFPQQTERSTVRRTACYESQASGPRLGEPPGTAEVDTSSPLERLLDLVAEADGGS